MKYIRTKDDRIVAIPNNSKLVLYDDEKLVIDTTKKGQTCVYGIVKKKADTIEELCDEFVYISKSKNDKGKHYLDIALPNYLCKSFKTKEMYMNKFEIYGAIWTDKGLIYKAKMKGVLPNGEIDWELL